LARRSIEVTAVLPDDPGNAAAWMLAQGVPVVSIPLRRVRAVWSPGVHLRFAASFASDVRRLRRLFRWAQADLVLLPGLANPHAAVAGRLEELAVVWQILDTATPPALTRVLMPLVNRLADTAMFWGESLIAAHGNPRLDVPVIVNSGSVDTNVFVPSPRRRSHARADLGIPEDAVVVGTVASWYPSKGVDAFVDAAAELGAEHPPLWFVMVGSAQAGHTGYAARIRRLLESAQARGARLRVLPARPDLENVYPMFDVMTGQSVPNSEGLATTILEAMACGIPVVATDVAATREAIIDRETGRLIPPLDRGALIEAIRGLASSAPERARLGRQARQLAVKRYDVEVAAETHARAFRVALDHAAARHVRADRAAHVSRGSRS
jgi:glycosyltransferase involved in cell wall biosynthesis